MKGEPPSSPIAFLKATKPECVVNTLNLVKDDVMHYVGAHDSISRLCMSVNDSAGGKSFDECYDIHDVLGEGGYAFVYRCEYKLRDTSYYAVKEVQLENYEATGSNIKEEIDALKRLRDVPHIVRLLDVFVEPERTCLVMEEMKGGDLLEKIYEKKLYSEPEARKLGRKLVEAIFFCHKKNIVHRDIKPENILLVSPESDTNIKLADFGCAKLLTGPNCLTTLCGSPQYVAPELYTHTNGYDEMCDLWSVGIVLYVLLGGYAPFEAPSMELPGVICEGLFVFDREYWGNTSDQSKDLIRSLLKVDVSKRLNAEDALDSEWLRRRDRESVVLDGPGSTFDAWVRRQNESSQNFQLGDSLNSLISRHSGSLHAEEDHDNSQRSLGMEDL
jgi:serine/threonine protein kinase